MESVECTLARHPFFEGIDPWYMEQLARYASRVGFQPEEIIIEEGEEADVFFLISEGRVVVEAQSSRGKQIELQILKPGEILGWSWLIPPYRWRFNARALDPVQAVIFQGQYLRTKCEEDPELGYQMMRRFACSMVQRLEAIRMKIIQQYEGSTKPRSPERRRK